jgi:hypothetical protein
VTAVSLVGLPLPLTAPLIGLTRPFAAALPLVAGSCVLSSARPDCSFSVRSFSSQPGAGLATFSSFYVLTGATTAFPPSGAATAEIRDGLSNTVLAVEAKRPIPWTKPDDIPYDPASPLPKLGGRDPGFFLVLFGDGSVQAMPQNIREKTMRAVISRAGGDAP